MMNFLSKMEPWSSCNGCCNKLIWAKIWSNKIWLGIFWLIQNRWRIRISCNYKSFFKLHILPPQISWEFFSPLGYFSREEFKFWHLNSIWKTNSVGPTCQRHRGQCQACLSGLVYHVAPFRHGYRKGGRACGLNAAAVVSRPGTASSHRSLKPV
jgi:hypothetical protein